MDPRAGAATTMISRHPSSAFPALLAAFGIWLCAAAGAAAGDAPAATAPDLTIQLFRYDISWLGIKAGDASLELAYENEERTTKRILSRADSVDWISAFYRVEDRAESRLHPDGTPYHFEIRQRAGKYRGHKEIFFEPGRVRYINHRKNRRVEKETSGTWYDVLSAFFRVKEMELEPGRPVYVNIFDSGRMDRVEVRVLRRETLAVAGGEIPAVVIEPVLKTDGLFKHKGRILIWLTDDARRIPLQVSTKVGLGSVKAVLTGGVY